MMAQTGAVTITSAPLAPQTTALFVMRRLMMSTLASFGVGSAYAIAMIRGSQVNVTDRWLAFMSLAFLIIGLIAGRRPRMLWFLVASQACLPFAAVLAPNDSGPWVLMPSSVLNFACLLTIMLPRWPGLIVPFASFALVLRIVASASSNVLLSPLGFLGGWFAALQVCCTTLLLWWAWWSLTTESMRADRRFLREQEIAERSIANYQRTQVWRQAATRLHESALNVIAHVLGPGPIDRVRLAEQLPQTFTWRADLTPWDSQDLADPSHVSVESAIRSAIERVTGRIDVVIAEPLPDEPVAIPLSRVVVDAVTELIANADRHGRARTARIRAQVDASRMLRIDVFDDGIGLSDDVDPGIGTRTVLADRAGEFGGEFTLAAEPNGGTRASLTLPLDPTSPPVEPSGRSWTPFDKARILVTTPLAGLVLIGMGSFALLPGSNTMPRDAAWLTAVLGIALACIAIWIVLRRRHVPLAETLVLAPLPIALTALMLNGPHPCSSAPLVATVLSFVGLATLLIAAWGHFLAGAATLVAWAIAATALIRSYEPSCAITVGQALNNALIVTPIILGGAYLGGRAFLREERARAAQRAEQVAVLARVRAARDLESSVSDLTRQTRAALDAIVHGSDLTPELRHRLEVLDGRLRAAIQVDPMTSGGVALAARQIVEDSAADDRALLVRSLSSSPDHRPLPSSVIFLLESLVPDRGELAVLRAMTDGDEDHLAVSTTREHLRRRELEPGDNIMLDDVWIAVEHDVDDLNTMNPDRACTPGDDARDALTVVVSRRIAPFATSSGEATDGESAQVLVAAAARDLG